MKLIIFFIIAAISLRLIPHIPNFAPITAIALFGGAYLGKRAAIILPLIIMVISDYLLLYWTGTGFNFQKLISPQSLFHSTTFFVWGSFFISSLIGIYLSKRKSPANVFGASLIASVQFFIITNFGVWATSSMYAHNLAGLIQSYIMGLPFFRATLLGDIFYTGTFFGSFELVKLTIKKYRFLPVKSKH